MASASRPDAALRPTASTPEFVATFAAVLVAIVALLFVDTWLARVDREESRAHAANLYADGRSLLAAHDPRQASDRFSSAVAIERTNPTYQLGLAEAMLADGRLMEAEATLASVLDRAETGGEANLLMARVLVAEGKNEEAKSFYHRAIYGTWPAGAAGRRVAVRFELIGMLARQHAREELLAELLPIQDVGPDSLGLRRTLGHLYLQAGSPARAVALFRKVLRQSPNDGDTYRGMGEAALALGNLRTARADLFMASRLLPGDSAVARVIAAVDSAAASDTLARRDVLLPRAPLP